MKQTEIWIKSLLFGFVTLFLCGIGDWLIGYEPNGGEPMLFGFVNTALVNVPAWFYVLSMILGILSGFGCKSYALTMIEILEWIGIDRKFQNVQAVSFWLLVCSADVRDISYCLLYRASDRSGSFAWRT